MEIHIPKSLQFWKAAAVAEEMGGIDPLDLEPVHNPNTPYFDKPDHANRSIFHQPQHIKHHKKSGNIFTR